MGMICVTLMALFSLFCSANAIPFMPGADLKAAVSSSFDNDMGQSLDMCELIELIRRSLGLEFHNPQYDTEDVNFIRPRKLKQFTGELLTNYLSGRQARQAQVGYNINSFGLRFGRRAAKLNMDTFWQQFERNRDLSVPLWVLQETFCSDYP
ncbi:uncharacterized protein ACMZJ9_019384 [Mantella aurantiaca]